MEEDAFLRKKLMQVQSLYALRKVNDMQFCKIQIVLDALNVINAINENEAEE